MKIGNLAGRLVLLDDERALDVEKAGNGTFGPDIQGVYERWAEFRTWAEGADWTDAGPYDAAALDAPVPRPRQVFAIGLNYAGHVAESGFAVPETPAVFTKFPGSISGPHADVTVPDGGNVDWEVEVVAVIGKRARNVGPADAWAHIAGLTIGQDLSERVLQLSGPAPQFSLGKSFEGFSPIGPWLVTPDEFADPGDLALGCSVNGEVVQRGRTSKLIFSIPALVAHLSSVLPLFPGDLIFTGTPDGVGGARTPPWFLHPGDELVSWVDGIGETKHRFVAAGDSSGSAT